VRCVLYKWSLQQDGAPSHTARNTNLQRENLQFTEPNIFCPPNSPDLNTVNLPSGGALQQTVYHHQSPQLTKWRERLSKLRISKTTAWRSHCQFITFITILFKLMLFAKWRHYFPRLIQINYGKMHNEETMMYAKFGNDLFNISKVIGRKTKWPRLFFGLPGRSIGPITGCAVAQALC